MDRTKNRSEYTYRCKICGFENLHTKMPQTDVPVTELGDYGSDGTPVSTTEYARTIYTATSVGFVAASGSVPAYLTDSQYRFGDKHFQSGSSISISTDSGTNDGDYTIGARAVSRGQILLISTDSLTTENAATAGSVVISKIIIQPSITRGCPFCGSLNSR